MHGSSNVTVLMNTKTVSETIIMLILDVHSTTEQKIKLPQLDQQTIILSCLASILAGTSAGIGSTLKNSSDNDKEIFLNTMYVSALSSGIILLSHAPTYLRKLKMRHDDLNTKNQITNDALHIAYIAMTAFSFSKEPWWLKHVWNLIFAAPKTTDLFKVGLFAKKHQENEIRHNARDKITMSERAQYTSAVLVNLSMSMLAVFSVATTRTSSRGDYILLSLSMFMKTWDWLNKLCRKKIKNVEAQQESENGFQPQIIMAYIKIFFSVASIFPMVSKKYNLTCGEGEYNTISSNLIGVSLISMVLIEFQLCQFRYSLIDLIKPVYKKIRCKELNKQHALTKATALTLYCLGMMTDTLQYAKHMPSFPLLCKIFFSFIISQNLLMVRQRYKILYNDSNQTTLVAHSNAQLTHSRPNENRITMTLAWGGTISKTIYAIVSCSRNLEVGYASACLITSPSVLLRYTNYKIDQPNDDLLDKTNKNQNIQAKPCQSNNDNLPDKTNTNQNIRAKPCQSNNDNLPNKTNTNQNIQAKPCQSHTASAISIISLISHIISLYFIYAPNSASLFCQNNKRSDIMIFSVFFITGIAAYNSNRHKTQCYIESSITKFFHTTSEQKKTPKGNAATSYTQNPLTPLEK